MSNQYNSIAGVYPPYLGNSGGTSTSGFQGTYNATTNTPTLVNGTGTNGFYYLVTVAGSNNPTGVNIAVNHNIIYNGAEWEDGGIANNSDEISVATTYVSSSGTVAIGQSLTTALGYLAYPLNSATELNTASTLVKRDSSGNFAAGVITASLVGTASGMAAYNTEVTYQLGYLIAGDGTNGALGQILTCNTANTTGAFSSSKWNNFASTGTSTNTPISMGYGTMPVVTGVNNTGFGFTVLHFLTNGTDNTGMGIFALSSVVSGSLNSAFGSNALKNATSSNNSAFGLGALLTLASNGNSSAFGCNAGRNATGVGNQLFGYQAGMSITTGSNNTLVGGYLGTTTLANMVVLSDGAANVVAQWSGTTQTQNFVLASPNGSSGAAGMRALVLADLPAGISSTGISPYIATVTYNIGYIIRGDGTNGKLGQLLECNTNSTTGAFSSSDWNNVIDVSSTLSGVYIGLNAAPNDANGQTVAVGVNALQSMSTGYGCTAVGFTSGYSAAASTYSSFFGWESGGVFNGTQGTFIGYNSGSAVTANYSVYVGSYIGAGADITTPNQVVLGDGQGNKVASWSGTTQTANFGMFSPNGTTGAASMRAMVANDLPATLNATAFSSATNPVLRAINTGALSTTGGAATQNVCDSGAAITNTSRLGSFSFAAAYDTSHTYNVGAALRAFATENWSSTANGTQLQLLVTANTTLIQTAALTLNQDASATFNNTVTATTFIGALTGASTQIGTTTQAASSSTFRMLMVPLNSTANQVVSVSAPSYVPSTGIFTVPTLSATGRITCVTNMTVENNTGVPQIFTSQDTASPITSGNSLGQWLAKSYSGSIGTFTGAMINSNATGTWSGTSSPANWQFFTCPVGSTTALISLTLNSDQTASFAAAITSAGNPVPTQTSGTFTPVLAGWTNVGSATVTGDWIKTGNSMLVNITIVPATSVSSTAITSTITGLPQTVSTNFSWNLSVLDTTTLVGLGTASALKNTTTIQMPAIGVTADTIVISGSYSLV
jgi:hypothetical protein